MDHIYIFNQESSASRYGIGTYIKHLTYCLKDTKQLFTRSIQPCIFLSKTPNKKTFTYSF